MEDFFEKAFAINYIEENNDAHNPVPQKLIVKDDEIYISHIVIKNNKLEEELEEVNIEDIVNKINSYFKLNLSVEKFKKEVLHYLKNKYDFTKDKELIESYLNNIFLGIYDSIYSNLSNFLRTANFLDEILKKDKKELLKEFDIKSINIEEIQTKIKNFYNFKEFEDFYYFNNANNNTRFLHENLDKLNNFQEEELMALIKNKENKLEFLKNKKLNELTQNEIYFLFSLDDSLGVVYGKNTVPLNDKIKEQTQSKTASISR